MQAASDYKTDYNEINISNRIIQAEQEWLIQLKYLIVSLI